MRTFDVVPEKTLMKSLQGRAAHPLDSLPLHAHWLQSLRELHFRGAKSVASPALPRL
jgi:hypothetical protein